MGCTVHLKGIAANFRAQPVLLNFIQIQVLFSAILAQIRTYPWSWLAVVSNRCTDQILSNKAYKFIEIPSSR